MIMAADRVLLIADDRRELADALGMAAPTSNAVHVSNWFDALAELRSRDYAAVVARVEPIQHRAEPAVRAVRELLGEGKLVLVAPPALEPLSRELRNAGSDDYIVAPADPIELRKALESDGHPVHPPPRKVEQPAADLELVDAVLDALVLSPAQPVAAAIDKLAQTLGIEGRLQFHPQNAKEISPRSNQIARVVSTRLGPVGTLRLEVQPHEKPRGDQLLDRLSRTASKLAALQQRHARLQKLVITDDLTGLYNGRYFHHFLERILERARVAKFPVTLLLFDIDNFKQYNDKYGHGVGDQILKQTAALMRRSCRDHDLVARIAGDEFAVVFWEKDGPRVPRDPNQPVVSRVPSTPMIIAQRFRKLLKDDSAFPSLGKHGLGTLSISGGIAVYPFDGLTPERLIEAADQALMFGAKRSGKDQIYLVGGEACADPEANPPTNA